MQADDRMRAVRDLDFHRWDVHGTMGTPTGADECQECIRLTSLALRRETYPRTTCRVCHVPLARHNHGLLSSAFCDDCWDIEAGREPGESRGEV